MLIKEDDFLKLYVERGRDVVWMADGMRTPTCSEISVSRFLKCLAGRPLCVRVLGMPQNATLLAGLCELAAGGKLTQVQIAGPTVCETDAERANPEHTLYRMRQCLLSASLGGWHTATAADTAIYKLAARLQAGPPADDSDALVKEHPVWRDLSFLGRIDVRACSEVLVHLIDPRWYVDPLHPDRMARAASFMGILGHTQRRILRHCSLDSARTSRYRSVLRCWRSDPLPSPADMERPEYFIWRRYLECGGGARGELRGSRVFLDYLLRTWLQRLINLTPKPVRMFSPSSFMRPTEAAAYKQHVAD